MSMPQNTVSTYPVAGEYYPPDDQVTSLLIDFENGGVALQDPTEGLRGYTWTCYIRDNFVYVKREGAAEVQMFNQANITEISFAFDQNMRVNFAYSLVDESLHIRWFDSNTNSYVTTNIGAGRNARMTLDDKRDISRGTSDVIVAYIRTDNVLCSRQQRDRYGVLYTLQTGILPTTRLKNFGMNRNYRLQFEIV